MKKKKTLVVGASPKPTRYSYEAVTRLRHHSHPVYAYGFRKADIMGVPISTEWPSAIEDFDTITLYLNPKRQVAYYEKIVALHPKRVIFNPGTENIEFQKRLKSAGIEVEVACTLVMLSIGNY